jgi:hypothetical protein
VENSIDLDRVELWTGKLAIINDAQKIISSRINYSAEFSLVKVPLKFLSPLTHNLAEISDFS